MFIFGTPEHPNCKCCRLFTGQLEHYKSSAVFCLFHEAVLRSEPVHLTWLEHSHYTQHTPTPTELAHLPLPVLPLQHSNITTPRVAPRLLCPRTWALVEKDGTSCLRVLQAGVRRR